MRDVGATVTKLVDGLKASKFLEVDEKKKNVRRITPLPDVHPPHCGGKVPPGNKH